MSDDEILMQGGKVRHAIFGDSGEGIARTDPTRAFAQTLQEAAVTGKPFVPATGLTDDDVRRREHPEEYNND